MTPTIPTIPLDSRAKLFRGLCDSSRLSILEALRGGPHSVSELVEATFLGQPNVSNHLSCLLDCGLVVRDQYGRFGIYSLDDERVEGLPALAEASEGTACR